MVLRSGLISEVRYLRACLPKETAKPKVTKADQTTVLTKISLVLESLRLEMALDIVLSGLELELYGIDELPFVYWYAETIINQYLEITVRLASSRSSSSKFQVQVLRLILKLTSVSRMVASVLGYLGSPLSCYTSGK
jgi:hypothetical protein